MNQKSEDLMNGPSGGDEVPTVDEGLKRDDAQLPRITFGRLQSGELDDTFVDNAASVHLELMDDQSLWIGVYLTNGERICFWVTAEGRKATIKYEATEVPDFVDIDALQAHASTPTTETPEGKTSKENPTQSKAVTNA